MASPQLDRIGPKAGSSGPSRRLSRTIRSCLLADLCSLSLEMLLIPYGFPIALTSQRISPHSFASNQCSRRPSTGHTTEPLNGLDDLILYLPGHSTSFQAVRIAAPCAGRPSSAARSLPSTTRRSPAPRR